MEKRNRVSLIPIVGFHVFNDISVIAREVLVVVPGFSRFLLFFVLLLPRSVSLQSFLHLFDRHVQVTVIVRVLAALVFLRFSQSRQPIVRHLIVLRQKLHFLRVMKLVP